MLAKQTAEIVTVRKAALRSNIFDFQIVAFEQLPGMFETGCGQEFIESHAAGF